MHDSAEDEGGGEDGDGDMPRDDTAVEQEGEPEE